MALNFDSWHLQDRKIVVIKIKQSLQHVKRNFFQATYVKRWQMLLSMNGTASFNVFCWKKRPVSVTSSLISTYSITNCDVQSCWKNTSLTKYLSFLKPLWQKNWIPERLYSQVTNGYSEINNNFSFLILFKCSTLKYSNYLFLKRFTTFKIIFTQQEV